MLSTTKITLSDIFYLLSGFRVNSTPFQKLLMVLAHIICWIMFFSVIPLFFRIQVSDRNFLYKELINKACLVGFFYLNYLVFVPGFLLKRKIALYILILIASFVLVFAQHVIVQKQFLERLNGNGIRFADLVSQRGIFARAAEAEKFRSSQNNEWQRMPAGDRPAKRYSTEQVNEFSDPSGNAFHRQPPMPPNLFFIIMMNVFYPWFFFILLGGFIHLVHILLKNQDEKKSLEMANLKAEVNLLKSQVNPHFLFNTLNGIYSQVYHNSQHAGGSILKLSEILRYVIYDSSAERSLLSKDLHYISNYIALQKLRLSDKVTIDYKIQGEVEDQTIAPLLLITFIENAFKHGISYSSSSTIIIHINIFSKTITMHISNPVVPNPKFESGGIGLANARRRLELLYPGRYQLDISREEQSFIVKLKIDLNLD